MEQDSPQTRKPPRAAVAPFAAMLAAIIEFMADCAPWSFFVKLAVPNSLARSPAAVLSRTLALTSVVYRTSRFMSFARRRGVAHLSADACG